MPGTSRANVSFTLDSEHFDTLLGNFRQEGSNTIVALTMNKDGDIPKGSDALFINAYVSKASLTPVAISAQDSGGGQAQVADTDATRAIGYLGLTVADPPYEGFSVLQLNAFSGATIDGSYYLIATDQFGGTFDSRDSNGGKSYVFDADGENRVTATTTDGQLITRLEIFVDPASVDILKQFRIDGQQSNPTPVPEPASLATAGMGLLMGLGYAWRRRKQTVA